ncbi:hypothetical protein CRUP_005467 [Coryphaenoides rupestris]|nr:hypothetical protein CRUP_005467 [Coryphaenoides rupestris]
MIHSEAWSACASLVNVAPYAKACVQDMCGCGNTTDDFCICSTLAEFPSRHPKFTILAQLVPCVSHEYDTCLKSVKVVLNNDRNNILAFSADGKVRHNMQIISLPYHTGLSDPGSELQNKDKRLRRGSWKATASSFGNSWKTSPTCPDREERLENPCSLSVETDKYTRGCPESQIFSYKLQRCQWTCKQLNSEQQSCTSDFLPVDGCSCAEGMYLDDKGVCVPMAKCPCYHSGVHINGLLEDGRGNCVKEHDCSCEHNGDHYASGSKIPNQCNTCSVDRKTTIRILLEPEHSAGVCGLCGDFNGDAKNDFMTQGQLVYNNTNYTTQYNNTNCTTQYNNNNNNCTTQYNNTNCTTQYNKSNNNNNCTTQYNNTNYTTQYNNTNCTTQYNNNNNWTTQQMYSL